MLIIVPISAENTRKKKKKRHGSLSNLYRGPGGSKLSKDIIENITVFKRKQSKVGIVSEDN